MELLRAILVAGIVVAMAHVSRSFVDSGSRSERYQTHLDRTSRSFAFCIQRLPEPMRERVGLAYLLCRAIDTVEDVAWPDWREQDRRFEEFETFLTEKPTRAESRRWSASFPDGVTEGERLLLEDVGSLLDDFHSLPAEDAEALRSPILSMARGMRDFARRRRGGPLRLTSAGEVNRYCFFVAGVVGEALTSLAKLHVRGFVEKTGTLLDAYRFGLFLQKVNLLKDQATDEPEGRFLVPSRQEMRASLSRDGAGALRYLLGIPPDALGFRLFCAWSLFLGLASLPFIQASWDAMEPRKISRAQTQELLAAIEAVAHDDEAMRSHYAQAVAFGAIDEDRGESATGAPEADGRASVDPEWIAEFRTVYDGRLADADIVELGLSGSRNQSTR